MYVTIDYIKKDIKTGTKEEFILKENLFDIIRQFQLINLKEIIRYQEEEKNKLSTFYDLLSSTKIDDEILRYTNGFIHESLQIN